MRLVNFVGFASILYTLQNVFKSVILVADLYTNVIESVPAQVFVGIESIQLVYLILAFLMVLLLICKMWTRHRYEFNRNIFRFIVYIFAFSAPNVYLHLFLEINTDTKNLRTYSILCQNDDDILGTVIFYALYFVPLLTCIMVIKMKKDDDVLQGISKLDMLLKVSRFQNYKDLTINKKSVLSTLKNQSSLKSIIKFRDPDNDQTITSEMLIKPISTQTIFVTQNSAPRWSDGINTVDE